MYGNIIVHACMVLFIMRKCIQCYVCIIFSSALVCSIVIPFETWGFPHELAVSVWSALSHHAQHLVTDWAENKEEVKLVTTYYQITCWLPFSSRWGHLSVLEWSPAMVRVQPQEPTFAATYWLQVKTGQDGGIIKQINMCTLLYMWNLNLLL